MAEKSKPIFKSKQMKKIQRCTSVSQRLEKAIHFLDNDPDMRIARVFLAFFYCLSNHTEEGEHVEAMPLREWTYSIPSDEVDTDNFQKEWLTGIAEVVNHVLEIVGLEPYVVKSERCASADFSLMVQVKR